MQEPVQHMFDPKAFIEEVLAVEMIDGGDVQALAVTHGLLVSRPLTAEQIAEDGPWHEWGCKEGDGWLFPTDAYKAWIAQQTEPAPRVPQG